MGTKIKVWHVVAFTALFTALITMGVIYHIRKVRSLKHDIISANQTISLYQIKIDTITELAAEANLSIVNATRRIEMSNQEIERLKQINVRQSIAIGKLRLRVHAMQDSLTLYRDSVRVPVQYIDVSKAFPERKDSVPVVELPLSFGFETDWSKTFASIDANGSGTAGFKVKSLPINLTLGSRGLFNKQYISVATTPNPEVSIDANNFQMVQHGRYKPVLIGAGLGVVLGTALTFMLMK